MDRNQLRKILFEKDKQMGTTPPGISSPMTFQTKQPSEIHAQPPKFHPSTISNTIKPTSNPSIIPSLPTLPKFAKVKKYFKKS